MARYFSAVRNQLQEAADLFSRRYGRESKVAQLSTRALESVTLLEREVLSLESQEEDPDSLDGIPEHRSL